MHLNVPVAQCTYSQLDWQPQLQHSSAKPSQVRIVCGLPLAFTESVCLSVYLSVWSKQQKQPCSCAAGERINRCLCQWCQQRGGPAVFCWTEASMSVGETISRPRSLTMARLPGLLYSTRNFAPLVTMSCMTTPCS